MHTREEHDRDGTRISKGLRWVGLTLGVGWGAAELVRRASTARERARTVRVSKTFTINREPDVVYAAWRERDQLPDVLRYLRSLRVDILEDVPNTRVGWRSSAGPERTSGVVHFRRAPGARGTEVRVDIAYTPLAGRAGNAIAHLLRTAPEQYIQEDLRRLKQLLETGEIARTAVSAPAMQPTQPAGHGQAPGGTGGRP